MLCRSILPYWMRATWEEAWAGPFEAAAIVRDTYPFWGSYSRHPMSHFHPTRKPPPWCWNDNEPSLAPVFRLRVAIPYCDHAEEAKEQKEETP